MAAHLIRSTDSIEVTNLGLVLYGEPGSRKTSMAQTADQPFTFAFDKKGIARTFGRRDASMFDSWDDVVSACNEADRGQGGDLGKLIGGAKTLVIDTLGMAMQLLADALIRDNPKNGNRMGGLSLPGYGALANQFGQWIAGRMDRQQDVVMICHEDTEKRGDELYRSPAIIGAKFYNELMRFADVVAYLHFEQGKRVLDCTPSDRFMAKTPPCGFNQLILPDFAENPHFLGDFIAKAKASMGQVSAQSAEIAKAVDQWTEWLGQSPDLEAVNNALPDLAKTLPAAKAQSWAAIQKYAKESGWAFDKGAKAFVAEESEVAA